ncbi:MAG: helix-turn-helix transcriptional regulator [Bacteroidales bacterium]|nr:helix-turn-helix transcriptional regulator [Bacteroidales bacterium]
MSDKAFMKTIGTFIQHHRLNQNRSQNEVAVAAGISRSTLSLLERGENVSLSSLIQVLRILDLLYIMDVFSVREEISPVEYAKLQKNRRLRARSKNDHSNNDPVW